MNRIIAQLATLSLVLIFGLVSPAVAFAVTTPSASLSFDPLTGSLNRGCSVAVNVVVNTGTTAGSVAQTDGTDAIIKYDPAIFSVAVNSIQDGTIYSDYPGNSVDTAAGKISISGLASVSQAFSGTGVLATINFTVKADAPLQTTKLTFEYTSDPAITVDSNIVERQTVADVLRTVNNSQYTIGSGSCSAQPSPGAPAPVPGGTIIVPVGGTKIISGGIIPGQTKVPYSSPSALTQLTQSGDATSTFIFIMAGSVLTILGILGLALL